jgi:P-type Ca2+ transporter type 2C
VLCNDAEVTDGEVAGDPTEAALLVLAGKAGFDVDEVRRRRRVAEVPFDAATKLMATLHHDDGGGTLVAVKGAPDVLLSRCTHVATGGRHRTARRCRARRAGPAHRRARR